MQITQTWQTKANEKIELNPFDVPILLFIYVSVNDQKWESVSSSFCFILL